MTIMPVGRQQANEGLGEVSLFCVSGKRCSWTVPKVHVSFSMCVWDWLLCPGVRECQKNSKGKQEKIQLCPHRQVWSYSYEE